MPSIHDLCLPNTKQDAKRDQIWCLYGRLKGTKAFVCSSASSTWEEGKAGEGREG